LFFAIGFPYSLLATRYSPLPEPEEESMKQSSTPVVVRVRGSARAKVGRNPAMPGARPRTEPTAERLRRAGSDFERGHSGQITMRDSPLERVFSRGVITQEQYAAGQKYRHHWYHAGLSDHLGSRDLERVWASDVWSFSGMARTEQQVFHCQRYREAVQAIGKLGAHVLDWSVCREVALDQLGNTLGWASRAQAYAAAAERLKASLDVLCKLWGIGNTEQAKRSC
jgi:hypothetical protein